MALRGSLYPGIYIYTHRLTALRGLNLGFGAHNLVLQLNCNSAVFLAPVVFQCSIEKKNKAINYRQLRDSADGEGELIPSYACPHMPHSSFIFECYKL